MPNYVDNILEIRSRNDDAEDIINFIKQHYNDEGYFDFNTFVPEPSSEKECPPKYNFNTQVGQAHKDMSLEVIDGKEWFNWFDWRIHYWGVKWNCNGSKSCYDLQKIRECYDEFSPVYIHFKTAWNAPFPIFNLCYKLHPELDIEIVCHSIENGEYSVFIDNGDTVSYEEWDLRFLRELELKKEGLK